MAFILYFYKGVKNMAIPELCSTNSSADHASMRRGGDRFCKFCGLQFVRGHFFRSSTDRGSDATAVSLGKGSMPGQRIYLPFRIPGAK